MSDKLDGVANSNLIHRFLAGLISLVLSVSGLLTAFPFLAASTATALSSSPVYINEVSSNETTEWVELAGPAGTDVSGWIVRFDDDAVAQERALPAGSFINANGYLAVDAGGNWLNNSGDTVKLFDGVSADPVDQMNIPSLTSGQTYGRSSGNSSQRRSVGILAVSSKEAANPSFSHDAVFNATQQFYYDTLADAVALAFPGDQLHLNGTHVITSTIVINKQLSVRGYSGATIQTSGTNPVFRITTDGTTVRDIAFEKTDNVGPHNLIQIQADNVNVLGNSFIGQWNIGDGSVVRALEIGTVQDFDIRNNDFVHVRQPAYINDKATGQIRNNYVAHTKGWVVLSDTVINFRNNSWGTGVDRNVLDIAITPGSTNEYPDSKVVQISERNNDAVVENQFGGIKLLSDTYVQPAANGNTGDEGSAWNPYTKVQDAMSRIVEGGTIHVADGTYTESLKFLKHGTKLVGESQAGTVIETDGTKSYGIDITGLNDIDLSNLTLAVPAADSTVGYHFKVYKASRLTLTDLNFNGSGRLDTTPKRVGGLDFNSTRKVTLNNVTASNYSKNGFAITARFDASDNYSRDYTFNNVTADNNDWAGIAFYNVNSSGNFGHNITNVTFTGNNHITNNTKGLEIVGTSDPNVQALGAPGYSIVGPGNTPVDLGNTSFSGNDLMHIINYQVKNLNAAEARFDGKTGNEMTQSEREAAELKITDRGDLASLGRVVFYNLPIHLSPADGTLTNSPGILDWTDVADAVAYQYQSALNNALNPDGSLTSPIYTTEVNSSEIDASATGDGTYFWQVRAKFADGSFGAWTTPWQLIVDATAPEAAQFTSPTTGTTLNGIVEIKVDISDNGAGLGQQQIVMRRPDNSIAGNWTYNVKTGASSVIAGTGTISYSGDASSGTLTITLDTSTLDDGQYNLRLFTKDVVGNDRSNVYNHFFTDNTKPSAQVVTPADKSFVGSSFTVEGTASDSQTSVERVEYTVTRIDALDGGEIESIDSGTASGTTNWHFDVSGLSDGFYRLKVQAFDVVGNESTHHHDVIVDTIAPTTPTITTPANEQYFSSTPILNQWEASDDANGINYYRIEYIYDDGHSFAGGPYRTVPGTTTQRNHVPSDTEQGGVTIRVQAVDAAGNASDWSAPVHYYYDSIAPNTPILQGPADGSVLNASASSPLTFTWDANGSTDVHMFEYTRSDLAATVTTAANNLPNIVLPDGAYTWQVRAIDHAGNISLWSALWSFIVDNTPPSAVAGPDQSVTGQSATLNGSSDDAGATYAWAQTAGPGTATFSDSTAANPTVTVDQFGAYTFQLTTTDSAGNNSTDEVVVDFAEPSGGAGGGEVNGLSTGDTGGTTDGGTGGTGGTPDTNNAEESLGLTTADDETVTPLAATTGSDIAAAVTENLVSGSCSKILGLCWYLWIPIVGIVGIVAYIIRRRADTNDV